MTTRLMEDFCIEDEKRRNLFDYRKLFWSVLKDPKLCRHLLLAPHIAEERNENHLSFIGYLKKLIMSREAVLQLTAVKGILSSLIGCRGKDTSHSFKEEKFIMAKLLDNDFVEFMCEALPCPTAALAGDLIQSIFGCLALLSGEDEFYHHFHAVYALESVLRTLHFVCEAMSSEETSLHKELHTLSSGLALIAIILEGSVNKSLVLEGDRKTVEGGSILDRVFHLITKSASFENPSIKWKSGLVVRSLLNSWHLGKCFSQQTQKVQESLFKKKKCSPALFTKGEEITEVKEVCRKMSFYHKGVQLIHTRSHIEESSVFSIQNDNDDSSEPDPLIVKEINLVTQLIEKTMKELVKFINNLAKSERAQDNKLMNQFLLLICQIGKKALRLLPRKMSTYIIEDRMLGRNKIQELTSAKRSQWEDIFHTVSQSIGSLCETHLVEIDFCRSSQKVFKECLTCLELLFQKTEDLCSPLSHRLATNGYLTLLPYLLTFDDQSATDYPFENDLCTMKSTCQVVLTHLLAGLAKNDLSWADSFYVLSKGLSNLPKNISSWPSVIASQACQPAGTAMVIFSYFYFLSSSRSEVAIPFLMPLVCFMKEIVKAYGDGASGGDMPSPVLKALWFSFAVSYLSNECPKDPKIEDSTEGLINCIHDYHLKHNNKGIKDLFTYHPAILYWAFSSPIKNQWIQLNVILMWLEGCQSSKSSRDVEQIINSNQDALICLLSIAENGQREVMECAMRTIWNFLQGAKETRRKEISLSLWEILIYVLKRFNAVENSLERERRALNVACMMQLTKATSLCEPHPGTVLRLAYMLNSTLAFKSSDSPYLNHKKSFCLLYLSGLQMLQFLLDVSLANEDTRVASSLLSNSGQLKRLEWASSLCHLANHYQKDVDLQDEQNPSASTYFIEDLNSLAFSIMTSLLRVAPLSQSSAECISLNAWHFLKAISSNHQDVSISSLKLLNSLVQIHIRKSSVICGPFVQIIDAGINAFVISTFIRILYLQFLMLCARASPDTESYCWEFLYFALQLPDRNVTSHLSKLPWNNSLIQLQLTRINGSQSLLTMNSRNSGDLGLSKSFLCFLHQWMSIRHQLEWKNYKSFKKMKSKGVGCIMFEKVLISVAKALASEKGDVSESADGGMASGREVVLIKLMLLVTQYEKDLPSDLSLNLRKKLSIISKESQNLFCSHKKPGV